MLAAWWQSMAPSSCPSLWISLTPVRSKLQSGLCKLGCKAGHCVA